MALQDSLYIEDYNTPGTQDKLALLLDGVIANVQVRAISEIIKNKNGSGTPESGTIEYKRLVNSTLEDYGTARAAGKGTEVVADPIKINIDNDKEIVEELEFKDLKLYGVAGLAEKRSENHTKRTVAYLDREFFSAAVTAGTLYAGSETTAVAIIDDMIVDAKETSSSFIDGIDAEDLVLVVNGTYRKALKNDLNELPNGTSPSTGSIGTYDSVVVYESNRMPAGVDAIIMMNGSVAQPRLLSDSYGFEKIPLTNSFALQLYLSTGVGALMAETITYAGTTPSI